MNNNDNDHDEDDDDDEFQHTLNQQNLLDVIIQEEHNLLFQQMNLIVLDDYNNIMLQIELFNIAHQFNLPRGDGSSLAEPKSPSFA